MPPDAILNMQECEMSKNIIQLSRDEIKTLIKINKIDYKWNGDLDGGDLESFLDQLVPNHVRASTDGEYVYFFDKVQLDEAIDNITDKRNDDIIQRIADRATTDWYRTDYIDYYYDLIDPIYESVFGAITDSQVYVNLYDYIIEKIAGSSRNELKYLKNKIKGELFKFEKWRDDDPDYNERYDTVIRTLKDLLEKE